MLFSEALTGPDGHTQRAESQYCPHLLLQDERLARRLRGITYQVNQPLPPSNIHVSNTLVSAPSWARPLGIASVCAMRQDIDISSVWASSGPRCLDLVKFPFHPMSTVEILMVRLVCSLLFYRDHSYSATQNFSLPLNCLCSSTRRNPAFGGRLVGGLLEFHGRSLNRIEALLGVGLLWVVVPT